MSDNNDILEFLVQCLIKNKTDLSILKHAPLASSYKLNIDDIEIDDSLKIKNITDETNDEWEGCLSIPDTFIEIERPKICEVEYIDLDGKLNFKSN